MESTVILILSVLTCTSSKIATRIPEISLLSLALKWDLNKLDSDTFLQSDWRMNEEMLEAFVDDCMYIHHIVNANHSNGFLDVAVSPDLVYNKYGVILGKNIRIIFKADYQAGDYVSLFVDTSGGNATSKTLIKKKTIPRNSHHQHIDLGVLYDPSQPYLAEYARKDGQVILKAKYYRYRPRWMSCMKKMLGSRKLNKLLLPGTHDSGAYTSPSWWQNKFYVTAIYVDYVFTQEDTIYSQLMQGARILDLRLGKYNTSFVFYVNHNTFKVHPLIDVIDQITQFLQECPDEIVVLDCHRFPSGFETRQDYDKLADFFTKNLGELIYRPDREHRWDMTLNEIWESKARIFIAFSDYPAAVRNNLYPEVDQIWGDKDNLKDLVQYMDSTLPTKCDQSANLLTSAMVEITPKGWSVLKNKYGGLRHLASITNSIVTNKFAVGQWGIAAQGVAVDFIASTGIVTAAIIQNIERATNKSHPCH